MTNTATIPVATALRRRDNLLARLRAGALDAQLAAGAPVADHRLRATRAAVLVGPRSRAALAAWWGQVVRRAHEAQSPGDPRAPVARMQVLVAEKEIQALVAALQAPRPVSARGVAAAGLLLRDGTGPVYNARSRMDLATAVRVAHRHL